MTRRFPFGLGTILAALAALVPAAAQQPKQPPRPDITADGVQLPTLFRGTESLIRGLDYPMKGDPKAAWGESGAFRLWNYALSGDGKRVWLGLLNPNEKELKKRVQIWSMNIDGGGAKQADFSWPEESVPRFDYLLTNHDGSVAWIYIRLNSAGGWGGHAYLQTVTPGGTAKLVAYTAKIKEITDGVVEPRLTKDGKSLFALTNLGVTRFDADGSHHVIADRKNITFNGKPLHDYLLGLGQLVISGDGSHWAVTATFQGAASPKAPQAIIVGSRKGTRQIVLDNPDGTFDNCIRLTMSEDGGTLIYHRENQYKRTYPVYLVRDGKSQQVRADMGNVNNPLLAAGGTRFFGTAREGGGDYPTVAFLEDLATGHRHRTMTGAVPTRWDTWWTGNDIRYFQASQNGDTLIAKPEGDFGLYVFRACAEPTAAQPTFKSVRQRYDGDNLRITVEATVPDTVGRVYLMPMKGGYLPATRAVPAEKNALAGMGSEAKAVAVERRPGVYEAVVPVGKQKALLDETFSFRVVVANADTTQATFQDFPVLR